MPKFYPSAGFDFKDFDLLIDNGLLYACHLKKTRQRTSAKRPNRYGMAMSRDGRTWHFLRDLLLPAPRTWEETIWAGGIAKRRRNYVIYYTGTTLNSRNNACKIGRAFSHDLVQWKKDPKNPVLTLTAENPFYSTEPKLAFRDPFLFQHRGKRYILFCAKDKSKPRGRRGCVGIFEERGARFRWLPPLFSPGAYFDGLECPALYRLNDRWYLLYGIDRENGEHAFRYAVSDSPFGPYKTFKDNQLLPTNNYCCRIVRFRGNLLLYHWSRDRRNGVPRTRLAPPKRVRILKDGRLSLTAVR